MQNKSLKQGCALMHVNEKQNEICLISLMIAI